MSVLKNPVLTSIVVGIVSIVLSYIDNKINNSNRSNKDYVKLFILVSLSVFATSLFLSNNSELTSFKNQEMLTGDPGF